MQAQKVLVFWNVKPFVRFQCLTKNTKLCLSNPLHTESVNTFPFNKNGVVKLLLLWETEAEYGCFAHRRKLRFNFPLLLELLTLALILALVLCNSFLSFFSFLHIIRNIINLLKFQYSNPKIVQFLLSSQNIRGSQFTKNIHSYQCRGKQTGPWRRHRDPSFPCSTFFFAMQMGK